MLTRFVHFIFSACVLTKCSTFAFVAFLLHSNTCFPNMPVNSSICWIIHVTGIYKEVATLLEHQKHNSQEIWWQVVIAISLLVHIFNCRLRMQNFSFIQIAFLFICCYWRWFTAWVYYRFKDIFQEVYEERWRQKFEEHSIWFVLMFMSQIVLNLLMNYIYTLMVETCVTSGTSIG